MTDNIVTPENPSSEKTVTTERKRVPEMPRLGEILVAHGLITSKQLETALIDQKETPQYIGVILMRHNWISERDLLSHFGRQRKVEFYNVHDMEIPLKIYQHIPRDIAIKYNVLPIAIEKDRLFVATEDPFDTKMIAAIEEVVNTSVSAGFAIRSDL